MCRSTAPDNSQPEWLIRRYRPSPRLLVSCSSPATILDTRDEGRIQRLNERSFSRHHALGHGAGRKDQDVAGLAVQREVTSVVIRCDHPLEPGLARKMLTEGHPHPVDQHVHIHPPGVVCLPARYAGIETVERW